MQRTQIFLVVALLISFLACQNEGEDTSQIEWTEPTQSVTGELFQIGGLRAIRLWGTNYERGYAMGYLLAKELHDWLIVSAEQDPNAADNWENAILPNIHRFSIPSEYLEEIKGVYNGVTARANGSFYVAPLNRAFTLDDMIAVYVSSEVGQMQCTSFAAWDTLVSGNATITARNMDYHIGPPYDNNHMLFVHAPSPDGFRQGFVEINWPGNLGCTTCMSASGVSLAQQDVVHIGDPSTTNGFCPDDFIHRKMIETIKPETALADAEAVLQELYVVGGCAPMATWPFTGSNQPSAVFEFDGDLNNSSGYHIRVPEAEQSWLIQSNHYRERLAITGECWRYTLLEEYFANVESGAESPLTVEKAWRLLQQVALEQAGYIVQIAAVYEPNKKLMHIALSENGQHAPFGNKITLDVAALIAEAAAKSK
ncbi:MAG: hypothetical protein QNJ97_22645 [Myxococcota bacterium]|nr:hypothetical protein [Myxococcota bacterium]